MGLCHRNLYTNNDVVLHSPLVCFGGFGQPPCDFVNKCLNENGYTIKITKSGRKRVRKIKELT